MTDSAASSVRAPRAASGDDEPLLAASRAGDAGAFVALARRHHPGLRALAGCWPGPAQEAELWPGEWADPPRPRGAIAERRSGQPDMPRALARIVRELGIAPAAAVTRCDVHGWPVGECASALERAEAQVRALLHAGREGVRAALEQEVDAS